jgi:protein SCO1/2
VFLWISVVVLVVLLGACSDQSSEVAHLPYYNTPDFTPIFLTSSSDADKEIRHAIDSFSFTDQDGEEITQKDIEGKIHVANFIFTSCGSICPTMTRHLKLVQDEFLNDTTVVLLSYSVTPWIDTVDKLKTFADKNGVNSTNWHLLTGKKAEIYTLARQSYFAEEDLGFTRDSTEFLHTEHVLLVDKNKRIRGIYNGTLQLEAEQLIEDIKTLTKQ